MEYLTNKPEKRFLVRLSEKELNAVKEYAKKNRTSANQVFRAMAVHISNPI